MVRHRIVWRDGDERTRGTLVLNQELESPVDGAKVGGGAPVRMLLWAEHQNREIVKEDSKDSVTHLPESLTVVDTGHLE